MSIDKYLKEAKNLSSREFINFIENDWDRLLSRAPEFPEIDTKSNLWPNVFEDICFQTGTKSYSLSQHRNKIGAVVKWRNDIAHGQNFVVDDVKQYIEYENSVIEVMYDLALDIGNRTSG